VLNGENLYNKRLARCLCSFVTLCWWEITCFVANTFRVNLIRYNKTRSETIFIKIAGLLLGFLCLGGNFLLHPADKYKLFIWRRALAAQYFRRATLYSHDI